MNNRSKTRLLAVDDNPMNQAVVAGMLEHLGYQNVDLVSDGRQAIDALSRCDYDAVLMDCQLPEIDGYQATRLIRDSSSPVRNHSVVVIALTANAMAEDRTRCLEAGMDDYLSKPIHPDALDRMLNLWLHRRETAAPASPDTCGPVFDQDGFLDRLMNNTPLACKVAGTFLRDLPSQLAALSEALEQADADRVQLIAHSLKSAAGTIGGESVRESAYAIERFGKTGDVDSAKALFSALVSQTEQLRAEIEEFRISVRNS